MLTTVYYDIMPAHVMNFIPGIENMNYEYESSKQLLVSSTKMHLLHFSALVRFCFCFVWCYITQQIGLHIFGLSNSFIWFMRFFWLDKI